MDVFKVPPAGIFPSFRTVFNFNRNDRHLPGAVEEGAETCLHNKLWPAVANSKIGLASSGTAALVEVLRSLSSKGRTKCYLSAYTCPEIVSAAVNTGFEVIPLDTELNSTSLDALDPAHEIDCEQGVLVLSNLYGLPDPLPEELMDRGLVVVDDACQAALSFRDNVPVGFDPRTYGVWSFGRGKAVCAFGGGAYRIPNQAHANNVHWEPAPSSTFQATAVAFLYRVISSPLIFHVISSIPGLGIGATSYRREVSVDDLSDWRRIAAIAKTEELIQQRDLYRRHAEIWRNSGKNSVLGRIATLYDGVYPIRLPAITEDESVRAMILREMGCFGVAASYPATLLELCKGESRMVVRECPNAAYLAQRLVTLPTHPGVSGRIFHRAFTRLRALEMSSGIAK